MTTLNNTKPKARKDYRCNFCSETIEKGATYSSQVIVYEGRIYQWRAHLKCTEIAEELRMYDNCDEGLTQNDFCENIHEEFHKLEGEQDLKLTKFKDRLDYVCEKILKK